MHFRGPAFQAGRSIPSCGSVLLVCAIRRARDLPVSQITTQPAWKACLKSFGDHHRSTDARDTRAAYFSSRLTRGGAVGESGDRRDPARIANRRTRPLHPRPLSRGERGEMSGVRLEGYDGAASAGRGDPRDHRVRRAPRRHSSRLRGKSKSGVNTASILARLRLTQARSVGEPAFRDRSTAADRNVAICECSHIMGIGGT